MEEHEQPELTNPELDRLLRKWKTPVAPARLRSAIFPMQSVPWYRRWLTATIRIPVPVAVVLCVSLVFAGWQWASIRERALVSRGLVSGPTSVTFHGFSPVAELRPRIIRSHHAVN